MHLESLKLHGPVLEYANMEFSRAEDDKERET